MRRPSIAHHLRPPVHRVVDGPSGSNSVSSTDSPSSGMWPSSCRTSPPMVSYSPSGRGTVSRSRPRRCAADRTPASRCRVSDHVGAGVVVLVADVADDLLDEVLDGDHARGAAVFVDHQRHLQPLARICAITASPSSVEGTTGDGLRDASPAGVRPFARRHREHLLDVDDAHGLVEVALDDREAGEAGLDRLGDQIGHGVVGLQRLDLPRGVISSSAVRSPNRSDLSTRVAVVTSIDPWRAELRTSDTELLRRARRSQLLGGFDAQASQDPVGGAVGHLITAGEHRRTDLRAGTTRAVAIGRATARFFGTSSPKIIDTDVAISSASASARPSASPGQRRSRRTAARRGAPQRFGEIAGDQGGDRDAQLGAGQLERQRLVRPLHERRGGRRCGVGVDGAAFQRGQRELGRDEQGGTRGQHHEAEQRSRVRTRLIDASHSRCAGPMARLATGGFGVGRLRSGGPLDGCQRHVFPFHGGVMKAHVSGRKVPSTGSRERHQPVGSGWPSAKPAADCTPRTTFSCSSGRVAAPT